jgi:hypothetical protein
VAGICTQQKHHSSWPSRCAFSIFLFCNFVMICSSKRAVANIEKPACTLYGTQWACMVACNSSNIKGDFHGFMAVSHMNTRLVSFKTSALRWSWAPGRLGRRWPLILTANGAHIFGGLAHEKTWPLTCFLSLLRDERDRLWSAIETENARHMMESKSGLWGTLACLPVRD